MDPLEQYLATKLAAKQAAGTDPLEAYLAAKLASKPAPAQAAPEDPGNPVANVARRILGVDPRARFSLSNVTSDKPMAGPNIEERLQNGADALNSAVDRFSMGSYGALNRAAGDPFGTSRHIEDYRRNNPGLSNWTDMGGYVAPVEGPINMAGQVIDRALPKVAEAGSKIISPLARAARRALQASGVTATVSASEAANHGASPGEAVKAGAEGAGAGLVGGVALEGLGALGRGVMNSRGGQARQQIEKYGGEVGLTTPGKGKPFDEMVTQGTTDADIGRQAVASSKKALSMLNAEDAAAKRPIGEQMSAIDRSPAGEEPENVDQLYSLLDESVNQVGAPPRTENTLGWALDELDKANKDRFLGQPEIREPIVTRSSSIQDPTAALEKVLGRPLDKATPAEVQDALRTLKSNERLADEAIRAGKPVPDRVTQEAQPADPRMAKASELNRIRRGVSEKANVGTSILGKDAGGREAAAMLRKQVDEGAYADVNSRYSKASYANQKSRRLLGISERRAGPEESKTTEERVANVLARRGQNTVTAGKDIDRLNRFDARHPDIAAETIKPALIRDKADLSFRLLPKQHGGLIDRTGSTIGGVGLLEAVSSLLGNGHVSPAKVAAGITGGLTLQNWPAVTGRLLYPGAEEMQLAEPTLRKLIPLLQAARNAQGDQ